MCAACCGGSTAGPFTLTLTTLSPLAHLQTSRIAIVVPREQ